MNGKLRVEEKSLLSKIASVGNAPFETRAAAALGVSVIADALDYAAAPVFALPVIGDVADVFVSGILFSITKSKKAAAINALEFIPVIGDFVPAYTMSTLMWIRQESKKRKKMQEAGEPIIIANRKMPFLRSIHESTARRLEENRHYTSRSDFSGERQDNQSEQEKRMRRLAASRYAKWKAGKYQ
jgi:hypothetical protein